MSILLSSVLFWIEKSYIAFLLPLAGLFNRMLPQLRKLLISSNVFRFVFVIQKLQAIYRLLGRYKVLRQPSPSTNPPNQDQFILPITLVCGLLVIMSSLKYKEGRMAQFIPSIEMRGFLVPNFVNVSYN